MVQLLIKLGRYLEARFPKRVIVLESDYFALKAKLEALDANLAGLPKRMEAVESNAVHKGAVQDLVLVVKTLKEEVQVLKVQLGLAQMSNPDVLNPLLNSEVINNG